MDSNENNAAAVAAAGKEKKLKYQLKKHLHHFIIDDVLGVVNKQVSIRRLQYLTTQQPQ